MSGQVSYNGAGQSPTLATTNVLGSPGSTIAGLAMAAPQIVGMLSAMALPVTPIGWVQTGLQIGLGILAMFAKG